MSSRGATAAITISLLLFAVAPAEAITRIAPSSLPPDPGGTAVDGAVGSGGGGYDVYGDTLGSGFEGTPAAGPVLVKSSWQAVCIAGDGLEGVTVASWSCQAGNLNARVCTDEDGQDAVLHALWRYTRAAEDQTWSAGVEIPDTRRCGPPTPQDNPVLSVSEFRSLGIVPSVVAGPPNGWTLANIETAVWTGGDDQILTTTLLNRPTQVRARPSTFSWDFGDGSEPLVTTDPGVPWPDYTVAHRYRGAATVTITLTTTWTGFYRVDGLTDGWRQVDGTATTVSTFAPLTVHTARARLVDGPLH